MASAPSTVVRCSRPAAPKAEGPPAAPDKGPPYPNSRVRGHACREVGPDAAAGVRAAHAHAPGPRLSRQDAILAPSACLVGWETGYRHNH
eukprot:scaffold881_cov387-Prasinococcus_capsulatus_cf.AAC.7